MLSRALVAVVGMSLVASDSGCSRALPPLPPPNPRECMRADGQARLLLVGPSGRAVAEEITRHLQANQLVAVQLDGCEMRIIKECAPKRDYYYVGYAPVQTETRIRSEAELFANVASVDDALRRHLREAHELVVRTVVSHRWDWGIDFADVNELHLYRPPVDEALAAAGTKSASPSNAACKAATHVVTMMTGGSYAVLAEDRPSASRPDAPPPAPLESEGDMEACEASRPGDTAPPKRCGAGFSIELLPIGGRRKLEPSCSGHTYWTGRQCADACGVGFKPERCSS